MGLIVRDTDTKEQITLSTEPYDNNGALLYFFHDESGNYVAEHLPPYRRMPLQSISVGGAYQLGERMVEVLSKPDI